MNVDSCQLFNEFLSTYETLEQKKHKGLSPANIRGFPYHRRLIFAKSASRICLIAIIHAKMCLTFIAIRIKKRLN